MDGAEQDFGEHAAADREQVIEPSAEVGDGGMRDEPTPTAVEADFAQDAAGPPDLISQVKPGEHGQSVGLKEDAAAAHRAGRTLQESDRGPEAGQQQRRGEAADAAAHHHDIERLRRTA